VSHYQSLDQILQFLDGFRAPLYLFRYQKYLGDDILLAALGKHQHFLSDIHVLPDAKFEFAHANASLLGIHSRPNGEDFLLGHSRGRHAGSRKKVSL